MGLGMGTGYGDWVWGLGMGTGNGDWEWEWGLEMGTGSGATNKQRLTEWDIGVEAVFSKEGRVAAPLVLGKNQQLQCTRTDKINKFVLSRVIHKSKNEPTTLWYKTNIIQV